MAMPDEILEWYPKAGNTAAMDQDMEECKKWIEAMTRDSIAAVYAFFNAAEREDVVELAKGENGRDEVCVMLNFARIGMTFMLNQYLQDPNEDASENDE